MKPLRNFPFFIPTTLLTHTFNFLRNQNLITIADDTRYNITLFGKEFLQWMVSQGVSEAKAF
jgi:hypothetical protein